MESFPDHNDQILAGKFRHYFVSRKFMFLKIDQ